MHRTPDNDPGHATEVVDTVGKIESAGVEFIPDDQRKSSLINVFWLLFGGSMTFGIIVIGWIPVSLGLGWWEALTAITAGTAVGSFLLGPMSLFGPRTGTNNPVASGAHFGARGRLIGSILGVTACIVFAALCIWAAGDVLAGSVSRLSGNSEAELWLQMVSYALVSLIMIVISVLGHANMVAFCKLMVPTSGVLMLVGIYAYWPQFDASFEPGTYALGSFWPTWLAGAIVCAATTQSYGPYCGDWTRHISVKKYSDKQIFAVTWLGGFIGMGGAYVWGHTPPRRSPIRLWIMRSVWLLMHRPGISYRCCTLALLRAPPRQLSISTAWASIFPRSSQGSAGFSAQSALASSLPCSCISAHFTSKLHFL